MYHGDIRLGETLDIKFTTRQISGAPFTLAGSPVISAYVGNGTTQLTAGITLTVDFDGVTGLNNVRVVASSGNGYATATNVQLVITTGTVNSVSVVGEVVGTFSIEARSALMPTTAARTIVVDASGLADANMVKAGPTGSGTAITARDIGASVLLSSGTGTGQVSLTSGVAKASLADVAHGGTSATITAERIIVASTTTNEPAMKLTGNGSGAGLRSMGGATGPGVWAIGGGTSGAGLKVDASGGSSHGIHATGNLAGNGLYVIGGDTGDGTRMEAGSSGGDGMHIQGFVEEGVHITGGATAGGVLVEGGATSGDGIVITTTDGHGISATATGTNKHGLLVTGGTGGTSDGIKAVAGTGGVPIRGDITGNITGNLIGNLTGNINTAAGTIQTLDALDTAQDTQHSTTQGRLPATLVNGRMDSTVSAINDDAAAAARLALSAAQIIPGTVDSTAFAPTTTEFEADDITEATAQHYNGRVIIFTSGVLIGQATSISNYSVATGRGHFTVVAMTEAPSNNDTFIIV